MAVMASNGVDLGAVYVSSAAKVRRVVRHSVRAPESVIEDACQTAWARLLRDHARVRPDRAVPWLITTAIREAARLTRRAARDVFLEDLLDERGELHRTAAFAPEPDEVAAHRDRLASLQLLPARQRQFVWLQALGWSYAEMSDLTGASPRTIDRQLVRARRALEIPPLVAGRHRRDVT